MANSVDPDETARYVSSRSTLFAQISVLVCGDERGNWIQLVNLPPTVTSKVKCSQIKESFHQRSSTTRQLFIGRQVKVNERESVIG